MRVFQLKMYSFHIELSPIFNLDIAFSAVHRDIYNFNLCLAIDTPLSVLHHIQQNTKPSLFEKDALCLYYGVPIWVISLSDTVDNTTRQGKESLSSVDIP